MQAVLRAGIIAALLAVAGSAGAQTSESVPGASVQSLLQLARERNPELAAMGTRQALPLSGCCRQGL